MSATALEQVTIPRELAINLLRETLQVVLFHEDLAGTAPAPLTADLTELLFSLGNAIFPGERTYDEETGEPTDAWGAVEAQAERDLAAWAEWAFGVYGTPTEATGPKQARTDG